MPMELNKALRSLGQSAKDHHSFLLRNKEKADRAYEEFVKRTLEEYREKELNGSGSNSRAQSHEPIPDPKLIEGLEDAWKYTTSYVLSDPVKKRAISKLIERQASMERVWTQTYTRFVSRGERATMLEGFYLDCLTKLEKFTKEAHEQLQQFGVPLVVNTPSYADLSEDGKELILRIQDELKT